MPGPTRGLIFRRSTLPSSSASSCTSVCSTSPAHAGMSSLGVFAPADEGHLNDALDRLAAARQLIERIREAPAYFEVTTEDIGRLPGQAAGRAGRGRFRRRRDARPARPAGSPVRGGCVRCVSCDAPPRRSEAHLRDRQPRLSARARAGQPPGRREPQRGPRALRLLRSASRGGARKSVPRHPGTGNRGRRSPRSLRGKTAALTHPTRPLVARFPVGSAGDLCSRVTTPLTPERGGRVKKRIMVGAGASALIAVATMVVMVTGATARSGAQRAPGVVVLGDSERKRQVPDRLRPAAPGLRSGTDDPDDAGHRVRAAAARLEGRELHPRLPELRRLDRTGRQVGLGQGLGERERVRERPGA